MKKLFNLLILLAVFFPGISLSKPMHVVVTLKPIHSIVSNVGQDLIKAELLLPDGASPHTFQLKPSHRKALANADQIIWVGPALESNLAKVINQYPKKVLTLIDNPNLTRLKNRIHREFKVNQTQTHHSLDHSEHSDHHAHHHHHDTFEWDTHIWLSIDNAKTLAQLFSEWFSTQDPKHAEQYQENAKAYIEKLDKLKARIQSQLEASKPQAFLVFHDAYQYLEDEFSLYSVGTILLNPHLPLTPKALAQVNELIKKHNIHCIFYEPEFKHQNLNKIMQKNNIKLLELDPLGARQEKGLDCYEKIMLTLSEQLSRCQSPKDSSETQ